MTAAPVLTEAVLQGLERTYDDLSQVNWRFLEHALSHPACLERSSFPLLENPPLYLLQLQSWPTFIDRHRLPELARVAVGLAELVRSVPARLFDGDPRRLADFYRLASLDAAQLVFGAPNGIATSVVRGDFLLTDRGFACIELNGGANLGGLDSGACAELYLRTPVLQEFFATLPSPPGFTNTLQRLLRHAVAVSPGRGEESLHGAAVVPPRFLSPQSARAVAAHLEGAWRQALADAGEVAGGTFRLTSADGFRDRGGQLLLDGRRVHCVLDFGEVPASGALVRAFKAGGVAVLNGPVAAALSDKRNLALLSELAPEGPFTAEERAFVDRHVPWTRLLAPQPALGRDLEIPTPAELVARREELVLKHARKGMGEDVYVGDTTPPEQWSTVVDRAWGDPEWVVQERRRSRPHLYRYGRRGAALHDAVWGLFAFGASYGGAFLRMTPAGRSVINVHHDATQGSLLEVG